MGQDHLHAILVKAASIWRFAAVCGLLGLTACAAGGIEVGSFAAKAINTYVVASGASLIHTDRTLGDQAISRYREQDCALLHLEAGETYCQDIPEASPPNPQPHCYRSIAAITCYSDANPYETASRLMPVTR